MKPLEIPEAAIDWVERLHEAVDEVASALTKAHASRLQCRVGCSDCCVDELGVFAVEAAVIARHHADLLASAEPHPEGACAFLDGDGACRVYAHRPYVCRTQGLPLRWLEREADGEAVEVRDVCPKNFQDVALESLTPDACWTLGPFEQRLSARQASIDGGALTRVPLRDLFERGAPRGARRLPVIR